MPYIYEDRISKEDFHKALNDWLSKTAEERRLIGSKAREYVLENYNVEKNAREWNELLSALYEKNGSWESRKNSKAYEVETL